MSETYLCRLCINSCKVYRNLYDKNCRQSQIYDIAVKYFEPMLLHVQEGRCLDCWDHIVYFHNFRQSVLLAQSKHLGEVKSVTFDGDGFIDMKQDDAIVVKEENDECVSDSKPPPVKLNDNASNEIFYDIIVKEEEVLNSPTSDRFLQELCYKDKEILKSNLFVTDEEELLSLVKSTPKISFNKSLAYTEANICLYNEHKKATIDDHNWLHEKCIEEKEESVHVLESFGENSSDFGDDESKGQSTEVNIQTINPLKCRSIKRKREEQLDDIIARWKQTLNCTICSETFGRYTLLQEHFSRQHSNQDLHIVCCGIKLKRRAHVAEHVRLHVDSNSFNCKYCSKSCTRERNLRYHMHRQHADMMETNLKDDDSKSPPVRKRINSKTCEEQQNDTPLLVKRKDLTFESQPHRILAQQESDEIIGKWMSNLECGTCKESCETFTLLHQHFRRNHPNGDGYIVCCERKFCRRTKFQEHIRIHLNPRAFECKLCGKILSTSLCLKHHMTKQHHISKENVITDQGNLNASTKHNSPENNSECTQTVKRKTVEELDDIIAQWRPNLECVLCNHSSSNFTLLQQHFDESHPGTLCYLTCCKHKFTGRHDIEEHIRFHNDPNAFKCSFCGRNYTSKRNLNRHERSIHNC